ncbi:uncharacterized protein G2W53_021361 [Senna tora]|uniref:Uncharacterized protein n=1 Tax=Senna tora TaxID=362788 RepID=A0A834TKY2_9FABA|nr:uncharacterized protein G2W53_021361 [Senna tora]
MGDSWTTNLGRLAVRLSSGAPSI